MSKNYTTYPNQKEIIVHKPVYTENYMSVGNDEWIEASKRLTYNAFKLYLYMASNCNEYQFALSKKVVQNTIGMSDNTYSNVVKELINNKYLVQKDDSNLYDFYTIPHCNGIPHSTGISHSNGGVYPTTVGEYTPVEWESIPHSVGGEISNISNISNLSKEDANAKTEEQRETMEERENDNTAKKRELEDLSDKELDGILSDYKNKVKYIEIQKKYNLKNKVTKDTIEEVKNILEQKEKKEKKKEFETRLGFSLDGDITLDVAHKFATEILRYDISKEDMEEDKNVHAKYGQSYTWNDFINLSESVAHRDSFYDYTAGLCLLLEECNAS